MEEEEIKVHEDLALFYKNNLLAVIAITTTNEGGAILRVDPRKEQATVALFDSPFSALEMFDRSIDTTVKRGWKCFHRGKPNWG